MVKNGKQSLMLGADLAPYLFELKQKDRNVFELLVSAITNLIPAIETIDPVVINKLDLKIDEDAPFELPDQYDIIVKERYNNQQTRFQYLSTGSMKLLNLLTKVVKAQKDGVQLLLVEELENSIHPRLLQSLLSIIDDFLGDTKLLFTSHSPNLAKYLSAPQLYIGLPSEKGYVDFRTLKATKVSRVLKIAAAGEMSLGEYLFDLMLDLECERDLISEFFTKN
jgi:predicted ATPase